MLSAVCCERRHLGQRLCLSLLLALSLLLLLISCQAEPINRTMSVVVDPHNTTIWTLFNLTTEQVNRITNGYTTKTSEETTQATRDERLDYIRERRINQLLKQLTNSVSNKQGILNGTQAGAGGGNAGGDAGVAINPEPLQGIAPTLPEHNSAAYPACNGETTIADWQQQPNLTLQFASDWFHYGGPSQKLKSAVLRLYKVNPKANNQGTIVQTVTAPAAVAGATGGAAAAAAAAEAAASVICPEPKVDSQLRITVYIIHQQKKKRKLERKKIVCNTMMLSTSMTGWLEVDIKCALNNWTQQQQQHQQHLVVGQLMIELHDDENNQLLPGQYFMPPNCEQVTGAAIPWPWYRSAPAVPGMENLYVPPNYPRIDVLIVGDILARQHHSDVDNSEKNESFYADLKAKLFLKLAESTTSNSPAIDNTLEQHSDCLERKEQHLQHQHHHHHRRRHHHSEQLHSSSAGSDSSGHSESAMDSSQQAETQHHLRIHHNHHHYPHRLHGHHQHHHNHHTHRQE